MTAEYSAIKETAAAPPLRLREHCGGEMRKNVRAIDRMGRSAKKYCLLHVLWLLHPRLMAALAA